MSEGFDFRRQPVDVHGAEAADGDPQGHGKPRHRREPVPGTLDGTGATNSHGSPIVDRMHPPPGPACSVRIG